MELKKYLVHARYFCPELNDEGMWKEVWSYEKPLKHIIPANPGETPYLPDHGCKDESLVGGCIEKPERRRCGWVCIDEVIDYSEDKARALLGERLNDKPIRIELPVLKT